MENATKALLISAGVLLSVMILTLIVIGYRQISNYYSEEHNEKLVEQITEFNKKFENYNRKNVRGSDLISLMNMVIDYNERYAYEPGTGYNWISVEIDLIDSDTYNQLKYQLNDGTRAGSDIFTSDKIDNIVSGTATTEQRRAADRRLTQITLVESNLESTYGSSSGKDYNVSSGNLQKLAANIDSIMVDPTSDNYYRYETKRKQLCKDILKTTDPNPTQLNDIQTIALQYYQFMYFKRAYFDVVADSYEYDASTGRIKAMKFIIQTDSAGNVVFN